MSRVQLVAVISTVALVAAGCGSDDESPTGGGTSADAASGAAQFDGQDVSFGSQLAQVRGHLRAALERYEAGDRKAAREHGGHPAKESLDVLRPEMDEHGGDVASLERAFDGIVTGLTARESAAALEKRIAAVASETNRAERAVVGEAADSDAYRGSVIADLVSTAAHEYDEALDGSRVVNLAEFQDGYGFVREGREMYAAVETAVREKSAAEAAEIDEAFEQLEQAMPSGEEPARPAPLEDVERAAGVVAAELEETVGAKPLEEVDPQQVQRRIERLLDEVVSTYDPADPDPAAELVAEAYLENYEVIEAGVIEAAPDVNAKLEPLLGAELRKRIREGAPAGEIASMTEEAKQLLDQAVKAVQESG